MPTNRTPISRPRVPSFTPEILTLFAELDRTPARQRRTLEFVAKSKRLAALLGLSNEWWAMLHVENANDPRPRPTLAAHAWWPRVQAVRAALLEALRTREGQPADDEAHPAA